MRLRTLAMLAPALLVIVGLFLGGLALAIRQSFGLDLPDGEGAWTWRYYRAVASDPEFRAGLLLTLRTAVVATLLSAAVGLGLALAVRAQVRRRPWLSALLQLPIMVPHLTLAVMLTHLLAESGLLARVAFAAGAIEVPSDFPELVQDRFALSVILAYFLKETPFVAVMVLALLVRTGAEFEEAARMLGASAWQRFRFVTLPLAAPALLSSALLVFALVFSAFEVPYLLGRTYPAMLAVIAQRKFLAPDLTERPEAMAIAVAMTLLAVLLAALYLRLARAIVGVSRPVVF